MTETIAVVRLREYIVSISLLMCLTSARPALAGDVFIWQTDLKAGEKAFTEERYDDAKKAFVTCSPVS